MDHSGSQVYSDVDGSAALLKHVGFTTETIGACRVLAHPKWHFNVYPATFFTNASEKEAFQLLSDFLVTKI